MGADPAGLLSIGSRDFTTFNRDFIALKDLPKDDSEGFKIWKKGSNHLGVEFPYTNTCLWGDVLDLVGPKETCFMEEAHWVSDTNYLKITVNNGVPPPNTGSESRSQHDGPSPIGNGPSGNGQ